MEELINPLTRIVKQAGDAILEVYHADDGIEIDTKSDDSPVTKADIAAHHVIEDGLNALELGYPILSEEGGVPDYTERQGWERYWLVDPLDGTKEFINKNGEFTVNIALVAEGRPVFGMVYVPVLKELYYGGEDIGAWKEEDGKVQKISASQLQLGGPLRVVGSRRHGAEALETLLEKIELKFSNVELVSMGSSLKICALAEGKADWYPRLALTSEWDTAAAHAVLSAAGGAVVSESLEELEYNGKDSLLNPFFHGFADGSFDWEGLLSSVE